MKNKSKKVTPHVAIRLGSQYKNFTSEDIIEFHNIIQKNNGDVFFGKNGRTFDLKKINFLMEAIKNKSSVYFILVQRKKTEVNAYYAPLFNIYGRGYIPNINLVPQYYRNSVSDINTWFQIGCLKEMSNKELQKFKLITNERPLIQTILTCRTALMLVKKGN